MTPDQQYAMYDKNLLANNNVSGIFFDDVCIICKDKTRWECERHTASMIESHRWKMKVKEFHEHNEALKEDRKNRRMPA